MTVYLVKATDVVAYSFNAETICASCMRTRVAFELAASGEAAFMGRPTDGDTVEQFLDRWAAQVGIDRQDERTYDSADFPKAVFASSVQDDESCGDCLQAI